MRHFLIIILILSFSLIAFADDPAELRAFYAPTWDVNTQSSCDSVITNAKARNVNAVFVEVRGRADAYYYPNREDSTYPNNEPRGQLYSISPSDLDSLQYYIDRLHNAARRVEVHAWCTTFNTWHSATPPSSPNHVYNAHPLWITENKAGTTYTYANDAPLDPGIPAVQDYLYNVFMDIVRNYDVDGIHFDYIRLLSSDSGYDPAAKAQFQAETGWNYGTQNLAGELDEVYKAWRRDQISQLVQRVHDQTMLEKPWVEVSAFLVNFDDSVEYLGQGYNWWVAHDAIDVLHPGCYSTTVSGTEADWNSYVSKLAQHSDQNKRPMACAVGSYLFVDYSGSNGGVYDPIRNLQVVNTIRLNTRVPDGFNFFAYGALFTDGHTPDPPDRLANDLFNTGGPMDDWAPVPSISHKIDEETTPPNPPASLSATLVLDVPRITFNRPSSAGDGDLPVHYRLYRHTSSPVQLYYANMVMEWWDLSSSRISFSFDDTAAGAGMYYYAAVSYDNWNNQAVATAGPVTVTTGGTYIIECRSGGQHVSDYSESGTFSNSSSHSSASGCTPPADGGIGSRFALPGDGNGRNDKGRFTPSGLSSGIYGVFVTTYIYASANAQDITVRVNDANGISTSSFDLTYTACGNVWTQCATMNFALGQGHYIEFDNTTQTNIGDTTNSRMNMAAVKFVRIDTPAKEPKPPVTQPSSSVTEVIVDSEPTALDYDDKGGWATTTSSPSGTLYNGNARYYPSGSFPLDDYAVWVVDLPRAGTWAIDGWIRQEQTSLAQGVQYRFVDGTGTVRSTVATQQTGSSGWTINVDEVTDGSAYSFNKGRVYITLYGNTTGSQMVIADALQFRLIQASVEDWELY